MITIVQGDLLKQPVDAIVNPANLFLRHGAGLARVIDNAAKGGVIPGVDEDLRKQYVSDRGGYNRAVRRWNDDHKIAPTIPTGGVHVTSAGCLPFEAVIHAVGPVWDGGQYYENELLRLAHRNIFQVAQNNGWSVAVPAISCGLFRFPVERAAKIAMGAAKRASQWVPSVDVTFALFEDAHFYAYADAALDADLDFELRAEMDEVYRLQELARR